MRLRGDDRAVTVQIGAVLLLGFLVISLSLYQATIVPDENERIEFSHSQEVQQDMQEVRNAIVSGIGGGSAQSVTVDLGVRYPSRAVAVNPGPAAGSLRTSGTGDGDVNLSINNANSTADNEVRDFWNGTRENYTTGTIAYQPNYNIYQNAPTTVYDTTILANQFRNTSRSVTGQRLIEGDTINVVTLNGSVGQSTTSAVSLDVRPVSASSRTVSITNASGPITISVATTLSNDTWTPLLNEEGNVAAWEHDPAGAPGDFALLTVTLEPGEYTLRMAKMGVGTEVREEDAAYVTTVDGSDLTVQTGSTQTLVAEVRDKYNNPVSGESVNASVISGTGDVTPESAQTDADGRVRFQYTAPNSEDDVEVEANISGSPSPAEKVIFSINVVNSGNNNNNNNANALPAGKVAFDDADGDGVYDDGEMSYTADEIGDNNLNGVDLIISKDATTDGIEQKQIDSLTIEDGVTVETAEELIFRVNTAGGSIDVSGATLIAGNSKVLRLKVNKGDGNINIEDARLQSDGNIQAEGNNPGGGGNNAGGGGNNELFANDNGGTESDGGTYIVDSSNTAATLNTDKIDTMGAEAEKGTIN